MAAGRLRTLSARANLAEAAGGFALPSSTRRLLDEMRALAARLRVPGPDVQVLDEPLAELRVQIDAMRRRLPGAAR